MNEIEGISPVLITGAAGFIGAALCEKILKNKLEVIGVDNINDYYNKDLKLMRLEKIKELSSKHNYKWHFIKGSIHENDFIRNVFYKFKPKMVINLAAQAGVRYSITNPDKYINSNIIGFYSILEACRNFNVKNLIYASSSSVYGGNKKLPYNEEQNVDHPISLYAATKKSNELMAHAYSHLYGISSTGLRFFTVYGPWGRPDMAPMIFAKAILDGERVPVYNNGKMKRDFTYIDDVIESIWKCCRKNIIENNNLDICSKDISSSPKASHRIFNVGNSKPINLLDFINTLELCLGKKALLDFKPLQPGDVIDTHSDSSALEEWIEFKPSTSLEKGIKTFADWYIKLYKNIT